MEFSVYAVVIMFLLIFGNQEELQVLSWNSGGTKVTIPTKKHTHVPWHLVKLVVLSPQLSFLVELLGN